MLTKPDYVVARHHELMSGLLEDVERGEIKRLMIFLPPRHGKSELSTRRFPAWYLGRNPKKQVICASYNDDFAKDFGREVRDIVGDPLYGAIFGDVTLKSDSKAADRWNTNHGGAYLSAGIGGGITGRGADLGLIDDPVKDRKMAESETFRNDVWNWYRAAFYTRLMPGAAIVLTLTRWHEDDLAGRLLREQKEGGDWWQVINLPAIAEGGDLLGREEGAALWPEWYPLETLEQIRRVQGSYEWNALYQQRPVAEKGNIFKRGWWRRYREVPEKFDVKIHSWDTAFKDRADSSYSVCTLWGLVDGEIYLVDRFKGKLEFPDLKRAASSMAYRDKVDAVLIEDRASGQSLIQELRRESNLNVIGIKVDRDKVARAYAATPLIEGGRVSLPEWGAWVDDYVDCMAAFPMGESDDDVDSTTQALNYLKTKLDNVISITVSPRFRPARVAAGGWMVS